MTLLAHPRRWSGKRPPLFAATPAKAKVRLQVEPLESRLVPSMSPTGSAFVALTGQGYSGVVGAFTIAPGTTAANYQATILWGDGQQSSGTIDSAGHVSGAHTFDAAGAYPVSFQVTDTLDNSTGVGVALGLVEDLTSPTAAQTVGSVGLTQSPTVAQSGSDTGGAYSLTETGTLSDSLTKVFYEIGGSFSTSANESATFRLFGIRATMIRIGSLSRSPGSPAGLGGPGLSHRPLTAGGAGQVADQVADLVHAQGVEQPLRHHR